MTVSTFMLCLVVALLLWGAHILYRWKQARDFAVELLPSLKAEKDVPESVSTQEFVDLYVRGEGPRAATYWWICAALVTLFIGPFLMLFNWVWDEIWILLGQSPVWESGTMIHSFLTFIALMGFMMGTLALAMQRYYKVQPPSLRQIVRGYKGYS